MDLPSEAKLKDVVENPRFYVLKPTFFGNTRYVEEAKLLDHAAHLLRVEIFRLKLIDLGARDDWIKKHSPQYIAPEYPRNFSVESLHSSLLRQVEYLRAELLFTAVRLARSRRKEDSEKAKPRSE